MHWRNSNFQYLHFIMGACHTPIDAHRKCCEAIEDRMTALDHNYGLQSHWLAKIKGLFMPKQSEFSKRLATEHIKQAQDEVEFLTMCKQRLEVAIGKTPEMVDYQQNQCEEWKLELQHRAENYLLCEGRIPPDHFVTMRMHPQFQEIRAHIAEVQNRIAKSQQDGSNYELAAPKWKGEVLSIENKEAA